jgi:hypothetical protein
MSFELCHVILTVDRPGHGLLAGDVGTLNQIQAVSLLIPCPTSLS